MKKIDIFPHIFPKSYFDKMVEIIPNPATIRRWTNIPVLYDLERRLGMMEEFGPDYQQILTLSMPAVEYIAPAGRSPDLAKLANDGMAEIVAKHKNRFPAFVASVPMNNVKATLAEITRAVEKLGAKGIQIFTNVNGRPLDDPEFAPIFEAMKKKGRRPIDYFRMFYGDTAINGSASGTRCGLDFFGREHVLFGTDCPFDPLGGPLFIRDITKMLDGLGLPSKDLEMIYEGNAKRMLKL